MHSPEIIFFVFFDISKLSFGMMSESDPKYEHRFGIPARFSMILSQVIFLYGPLSKVEFFHFSEISEKQKKMGEKLKKSHFFSVFSTFFLFF